MKTNLLALLASTYSSKGKRKFNLPPFSWAVIALTCALSVIPSGAVDFDPAVNYTVEDYPRGMTMGDLNGDSIPDLVVATHHENVSIRMGNGDGTFAGIMNYGAGLAAFSAAIADLDNDTTADLAIANFVDDDVSILLGNGDGTFNPKMDYGVGDGAETVSIDDFNGDTFPDLAVLSQYDDYVSILLGNGDGTFNSAVKYRVGDRPVHMAVGDLNGDAIPDLAVILFWDSLTILLGVGDGTFADKVEYLAYEESSSIAIGDLNSDLVPDLAVANREPDGVSIFLGNGDGTFATRHNYTAGTEPMSLAIGDLDNDGILDLAVANNHSDDVSILIGNGDGSFASGVEFAVGDSPRSVVIGDLENDGDLDLAVANSTSDNVSILINSSCSGCWIDDFCHADGALNPEDICSVCDETQSSAGWSWNDECAEFSVPIALGYNILGRAMDQPKLLWASDIALDIDAQGGSVLEISVWSSTTGSWRTYDPTFPIDDFIITPTDGFIVRAAGPSVWEIEGLVQMDGPQLLDSVNGYTLVAVPSDDYAMVSDLVADMNGAGCLAGEVSRWDTSTGAWETYDPTFPLYDYTLDRITGYFIRGAGSCQFDVHP